MLAGLSCTACRPPVACNCTACRPPAADHSLHVGAGMKPMQSCRCPADTWIPALYQATDASPAVLLLLSQRAGGGVQRRGGHRRAAGQGGHQPHRRPHWREQQQLRARPGPERGVSGATLLPAMPCRCRMRGEGALIGTGWCRWGSRPAAQVVCVPTAAQGRRQVHQAQLPMQWPPPPSPDNLAFGAPCRSNFITDRPSSRVLAPPGGGSSIVFG